MSGYVIIQEIFTRKKWLRKVADGPWEEVDLTLYNGIVPVVFMSNDPDVWQARETWADQRTLLTEGSGKGSETK